MISLFRQILTNRGKYVSVEKGVDMLLAPSVLDKWNEKKKDRSGKPHISLSPESFLGTLAGHSNKNIQC